MENIVTSYTHADYFVDKLKEPIRIGRTNQELDAVLKQFKAVSWCFVTASNPLSVEVPEPENIRRNKGLEAGLSKYKFLRGEGRDPAGGWQPERSFLILGISLRESKRLARKYCQRAVVFGKLGRPAELIESLFTSGNCELIRDQKTAFFGSRTAPREILLKCIEWAAEQREARRCVISGFHSSIEREVLSELLKGEQPLIQVLATRLKRRPEPELSGAFDDGRLLVISPFDEKTGRASEATAAIRNALIADLADEVVCGHAGDSGSLKSLLKRSEMPVKFV